jgi:uncharacterized cupin superfamily protein
MPKLPALDWTEEGPLAHPVLGATLGPYAHKPLGDAGGLTQVGVHLERLPPGSRSSVRHWHEAEDELVYLLAGTVILVEHTETPLAAGDVAAWKAGAPVGHCLENRSGADAVYLVVGTRGPNDVVHYPDHGVTLTKHGAARRYSRADGTVLKET